MMKSALMLLRTNLVFFIAPFQTGVITVKKLIIAYMRRESVRVLNIVETAAINYRLLQNSVINVEIRQIIKHAIN